MICLLILPVGSFAKDGGVMPNSIFYILDVTLDQLQLVFTPDPVKRARVALQISSERLGELEVMSQEGDVAGMAVAGEEYNRIIDTATSVFNEYEKSDATEDIEDAVDIEKVLLERDAELERVAGESELKFVVKEKLSSERLESLRLMFNKMRERNNKMQNGIEMKKVKIRARLLEEVATEEEVDEIVKNVETATGTFALKKQRAQERLDQAKIQYDNLREAIETTEPRESVLVLYNQTATHIERADEAFWTEKYGEAYGQATSALSLARNSLRQLNVEEDYDIVAVSEGEKTKVRVMVGDSTMKFDLDATDENIIMDEVIRKTGLNLNRVSTATKFKEKKLVGKIEQVIEEESGVKVQVRVEEKIRPRVARGASKIQGTVS